MCAERLSYKELMARYGAETREERDELLNEWAYEGIVPALCSEGCEVEPDGICEHGFPSVIMARIGC